jgi:hypothetical protein
MLRALLEYSQKNVPGRYLKGLKGKERTERSKEIARRSKEPSSDPHSYRPFKTDKGQKTKTSSWAIKYKKRYGEQSTGTLSKVASASGISQSILKQVYNKGLAAWRTGHRPGASQHAWAWGRVYSFVMKGPTTKGPDKKLAQQAGLI